jgi:hypothetical protein
MLQQTITMNENAQWQMIKDSVLFALNSGFSVSFLFEKKSTRGVLLCISSFYLPHIILIKPIDTGKGWTYIRHKQKLTTM